MKIYTLKCCGCQREYTTKWYPRNNIWYCGKSCANKYNPRRQMEGKCHRCQTQISASRKYCKACLLIVKEERKTIINVDERRAKKREYLRKAVKSFVRRLKDQAVIYKGGKCQVCGYNRFNGALDFHHIDDMTKSFTISGKSMSFDRLRPELDKCILVCSNCHREIHGGIIDVSIL